MIKRFIKRITRDGIDAIFLALMLAVAIANIASIVPGEYDWNLMMALVFIWALRLVIAHSVLWEMVDKHVTDDNIRRNIFGIGPYDPEDFDFYRPRKHWFDLMVDIFFKLVIIAFVAFTAIRIIFY